MEQGSVRFLCKIDRKLYACVSENIVSEDVVITDERVQHIRERHPEDFEKYARYMADMILHPHYIIEDEQPGTAFVLKRFSVDDVQFRLILRLHTYHG